jgi:hypothetical protein
METDLSFIFYTTYFNLKNRFIEIILKNEEKVKGEIIGFYKGDEDFNEPYIIRWHIATEEPYIVSYPLKEVKGRMISQKEIAAIKYTDNNNIIQTLQF